MRFKVTKQTLMKALEEEKSFDGQRWIKGHYLWPDFIELEGEVIQGGSSGTPSGCNCPGQPCSHTYRPCHKKEEEGVVTDTFTYEINKDAKEKGCCEKCFFPYKEAAAHMFCGYPPCDCHQSKESTYDKANRIIDETNDAIARGIDEAGTGGQSKEKCIYCDFCKASDLPRHKNCPLSPHTLTSKESFYDKALKLTDYVAAHAFDAPPSKDWMDTGEVEEIKVPLEGSQAVHLKINELVREVRRLRKEK